MHRVKGTVEDRDSLKQVPVEQRVQVIIDRQLIAVPQDGGYTVEMGWRRHQKAKFPQGSCSVGSRTSISHRTAYLMRRYL